LKLFARNFSHFARRGIDLWFIVLRFQTSYNNCIKEAGTPQQLNTNYSGPLIGIFRKHSFRPPVGNNFGKFLQKIFFDNAGTIRKSRANFFPPP
jgi:hypothetical protein